MSCLELLFQNLIYSNPIAKEDDKDNKDMLILH